ncbi:MAG TPA: DUF2207 domain-containing protein [Clostridiales bacterium]|jgi:uncharacterized membrane protein|nr:DUF2207 domain-containing protein [Clostridiales bacterium]
MKKYINGIIVLLIAVFFSISFPKHASAEEDLLITEWKVAAYLQTNGDLIISEDITFEFNEKFNGVYRDIVFDETSGISDIDVALVVSEDIIGFSHVEKAKNGEQGVYTVNEKNNKIAIKIFSPSKDETKTFRISYTVKNTAVKYNDTGELYYKFIGKENETPINNLIIDIYLPYEDRGNDVKVFAHGPLNGRIEKINNRQYRLKVKNVPEKTFVEGRVLVPVEYIADSPNILNIDKYQDIIDEEAAFQAKIELNRLKRESAKKSLNNITIIFSGICLLALAVTLNKCRRNVNKDLLRIEYKDIPEDCTPAVAGYIANMHVTNNMIFATILDLFRKGYLRIYSEDETDDLLESSNFIIEKTADPDMTLTGHERYFMNWLFDYMGNTTTVSTSDIKDYAKHKSAKFFEKQNKWTEEIKKEADRLGYYDHSKTKLGAMMILLSIVGFVLGIITAVYGSLYALFDFAAFTVTLVYGITLFIRLSDKGYMQYKKWISFKKYMTKIYPDLTLDAIDITNPTLIYALSLNAGVCKSLAKRIGLVGVREAYDSDNWVFWYMLFSIDSENSFNKSIRSSFAASSSSGRGFSGGGGGGAGGGGAGGF